MTVENLEIKVKATGVTAAANRLISLSDAMDRVQGAASSISGSAGTQAAKSVEKVGKAAKKANKPLGNFLSSLKRIAFYRIIRDIIKSITQAFQEGLEKAYLFSQGVSGDGNRFAAAMDRMKSAGNQMKGQLGSAFISLLAAVEPVLILLINLVTKAADAISQFLAAFTGKTYLKANATAAKFADTMERGGAAAKEWKNQLLGFDEINRLNEPNQGGGGSSANPLDGYSFEDAPISQGILDFVNKIKEKVQPALDRLKESFGRLKEAWDRFAESFDGSALQQLIEDLTALGGELIINGLTILTDTLTVILEVLAALNTGDWSGVWKSLNQLLYDTIILVADLFVGLTLLVEDCLIALFEQVDKLLGTDLAGWLRADKEAFQQMYIEAKNSDEGLFGLKVTLGLTEKATDKAAEGAGEYTEALADVSEQSTKTEEKLNGIKKAVDWVKQGFIDFGTEVGYIFGGLFQPLQDLAAWLDRVLAGFGMLRTVNSPNYNVYEDSDAWLTGFASGGFPTEGQLFLANEAGPEMVGTMGGRTTVATNADIVEGIRNGVYDAVVAANGNGGGDVSVKVYLDSREIKAGQQRLNRAWGV